MSNLDQYRNSHAELRQMIAELKAILTPELLKVRPNAKNAYDLLCDHGAKLSGQLAAEDRGLGPTLRVVEEP